MMSTTLLDSGDVFHPNRSGKPIKAVPAVRLGIVPGQRKILKQLGIPFPQRIPKAALTPSAV